MKLTDVILGKRRLVPESTFYFYKVQDQEKLIKEESRSVGIEKTTVVIFLRILMTACTESPGVLEMFSVLIWVVFTKVYTYSHICSNSSESYSVLILTYWLPDLYKLFSPFTPN